MDGVDASIIQTDGKSKYKSILDKYFENRIVLVIRSLQYEIGTQGTCGKTFHYETHTSS